MHHLKDSSPVSTSGSITDVPSAMRAESSMNCFKTSLLPQHRPIYESLYKGSLNKFHQSGLINGRKEAGEDVPNRESPSWTTCPIVTELTKDSQHGQSIYLTPE